MIAASLDAPPSEARLHADRSIERQTVDETKSIALSGTMTARKCGPLVTCVKCNLFRIILLDEQPKSAAPDEQETYALAGFGCTEVGAD